MNQNIHGGDIYSRKIEYDFSANINPLGMPESVKRALIENIGQFEHYPDPNCTALRRALAIHENVAEEQIVCGNGAADLIYRAVQAVKPKHALIPAPTFSEYEKALLSVNCDLEHYFTCEADAFSLREDILDRIDGMDMLFLCHPNNPVGNLIDRNLLERILKKSADSGAVLVIDECFMDFVEGSHDMVALADNVMVLKAFTKIYAMAGLRLGYLLCGNPDLARKIAYCGQCWSVSIPAQVAGIAALREQAYVSETVKFIAGERAYLCDCLKNFGFKVYPSEANFILFQCKLPLDEWLLKEKIAIRNCSNYIGLRAGYFRIAVRNHKENQVLIAAIERCIEQNG